jgi:hypothetical protein
MLRTIWNRQTGEPMRRDTVDAREILATEGSLYSDVDPNPSSEQILRPVSAADEFRREPVGENPPEAPIDREHPVIRNQTGAPRLGVSLPDNHDDFVRPKSKLFGVK